MDTHSRPDYLDDSPSNRADARVSKNPPTRSAVEPLLLAGLCFFAGFVAGSGRWELLTRTGRNLLRHTGILLSDYAAIAVSEAGVRVRENLNRKPAA